MTEARGEDMRNFLKSLATVPNVVALVFFLIGVGGWWQDQRAFRDQVDIRLTHVESRLDKKDSEDVALSINRAEVRLQLLQIATDVTALRDELKEIKTDVKNEVRKIR